jgi:glycine dehydrogenase
MTHYMAAREQHIRREKATSNICTSQALLANMAAMYAVYHGPRGLREIAEKVHAMTILLKDTLERLDYKVINRDGFFDTLTVETEGATHVYAAAIQAGINIRQINQNRVGLTLDESVTKADFLDLVSVFNHALHMRGKSQPPTSVSIPEISTPLVSSIPESLTRTSAYLPHPVFNKHHSETEMLRYIHHLQAKDLSLVHAMIPLGSCTMKLNSTSSMIPVTMDAFSNIHPFAPVHQVTGYQTIIKVYPRLISRR